MVDTCLSRHFYRINQNRTKMATFFATPSPPSTLHILRSSSLRFPRCLWSGLVRREKLNSIPYRFFFKWNRRRTLICAASQDAENSFRKTVEMDRLIDMLRAADDKEVQKLVVENVLSFNESFWIRLAARADNCKSEDDKKDLEELASFLMSLVDRIVHKTYEKIESATDVLKAILRPVAHEEEEIPWPPRDPEALSLMEKEINQREQGGQLDEGFLSEVNAQLRNAKEDGDKPGLEAMLQKVLQLYASRVLSKRSYARKGDEILKAEQFLETIIKAPEEEWNRLLLDGMTVGKGEISPEELYSVVNKRIERTLIRTQGGSYEQRVLVEYLKGIQSRAEEIVQVLQGQG